MKLYVVSFVKPVITHVPPVEEVFEAVGVVVVFVVVETAAATVQVFVGSPTTETTYFEAILVPPRATVRLTCLSPAVAAVIEGASGGAELPR